MKSSIVDENPESQYPCTMEHVNNGGLIVLFSCSKIGMVIHSSDVSNEIGHHYSAWAMELFKPWSGTIKFE